MRKMHFPYVILGAGAMGSAAAYQLAKRGERVLLIERFRLGHDRGSSHGAARIIRYSYADPRYARLVSAAFAAWREFEADLGQCLYVRTGGLSVCQPGVEYVRRVAENLAELGVAHRRMSGAQVRKALPQFAIPDDYDAVFEPDAGMVAAARAVAGFVELARDFGAERFAVNEELPIERIDLDAPRPTLHAPGHEITADRLIVTAGAWVGKLLPSIAARVQTTVQRVLYLRPADPAPFAIGRLPAFIGVGAGAQNIFYGMPAHLGGGVKVARHGGPAVDPDAVDRETGDDYRRLLRDWLRLYVPALEHAPIESEETCLYTVAPGENFLVGPLPGRDDVIVASPCSGHGFKFSCLVGRVIADLATTGRAEDPFDSWRLDQA